MTKTMKCVALIAIIVSAIMTAMTGLAEEPYTTTTMYVAIRSDYLSVRFSPSEKATLVGRLYRGDDVKVIDIADGWAHLEWGDPAYVKADYLATEKPIEPTVYRVVANGKVRLRDKPGGEKVGWAYPGNTLTVYGWTEIEGVRWALLNGCYIMAEFLELPYADD